MVDLASGAASAAMARYAQGDDRAFSEVYDALAPRLCAYLRRRLGKVETVEDVLQQTFLQMHLHRSRFAVGARVEPWAYAIARTLSIDALRREARRATDVLDPGAADPAASDPLALAGAEQLGAALEAELVSLSPVLREAFILVRLEGLTHAEAAEVTGVEIATMKVRAHRASQSLRERLLRYFSSTRVE
jgi:RNA polymerase sigma-70 factor (ECF subfamily)